MLNKSISIIIPAYNVEKYLKAALDSIKNQEQLPDEIILIDDGSTDETLKIAENYSFPIPYKVISIENKGQGNARNMGVSIASSEYVYFFDSDDLLTKDFIRKIKSSIIKNDNPDILLFSGQSFNDPDYQGERWINYRRGFSGVFTDRTNFLDKGLLNNALFCSPCLYLSKKTLWSPTALAFNSNFLEDEAIFYPLLFACNTFVVTDDVFFLRRNREGSTMTIKKSIKHVEGSLNCIDTSLKLYQSSKLTQREKEHISKRLQLHCVSYVKDAVLAGCPMQISKIIKIILKTKSINLAMKVIIFSIRADKLKIVRKINDMIKSGN